MPANQQQAMPPSEGASDVHPKPSKPNFIAPAGSVDAHCHVFGPSDIFPYSPLRKYTPYDAPAEKLFALRDHIGFARNVIVQASCHGKDNSAMCDALKESNGTARGVAIIDESVTDSELHELHESGVRGVRFNFIKRLVDPKPKSVYLGIANRIAKLGWHCVVYFEAEEVDNMEPFLKEIPTITVIDHLGRPDIAMGVDHDNFKKFIRLLDNNSKLWVKVSCPERLSVTGPPYDDFTPFARTLVERYSDRVLWGTDWPHPNMSSHIPDDGILVDQIPRIAATKNLQKKLLVDNPMKLYWPEQNISYQEEE